MSAPRDPEQVVRAFFAAYSDGAPQRFDEVVAPDYADYGHTPPGHGRQGAKDDYEHAVKAVGGVITYDIDALVSRGDTVAAVWTGHLPDGKEYRGLSLYLVTDGRLAETRHSIIGALPS